MSIEYRIEQMRHVEGGYQVAIVISFFDQSEHVLHNRWGSWRIGEPGARAGREAAVISKHLPFDLQEYLHRKNGSLVQAAPVKDNPFIRKAASKKNLFVEKAKARPNLFLTKAKKA